MNKELILKIRREAITKWLSNHKITVHKFSDEPVNIESLEIFAELIVRECCEIISESDPSPKMTCQEPYITIAENIKEHFGIDDE